MIKRLYAHNFRCLINFELQLRPVNLLLGPNGSGKSTVFDLLNRLSMILAEKAPVGEIFPLTDLTRWSEQGAESSKQRFELDMEGNGGLYQYTLEIEHKPARQQIRIGLEKLHYGGRPLYEFSAATGKANLYRDNHSPGGEYLFDWSVSGIAGLHEREENSKLRWFRDRISNLLVVRPNPVRMGAESRSEIKRPDAELTDFASWYRYLSQERQGQVMELNNALREIIQDFDYLRLKEAGEGKILVARFKKGQEYKLTELSDGQRMIIALYTILNCLPEAGATFCVDEPENFLALSEIQPWLDELEELCETGKYQVLLISHHPRPINYFSNDAGLWVSRAGIDQPSRVSRIGENESGISMSHLVERGWIYDA